MPTKTTTKSSTRRAPASPIAEMPPDLGSTAPTTTEDRLVRIQALGQRIDGHIRFIRSVANLNGTSPEAKDKAVAVFYESLVIAERRLGRIHEELELG
jgi:hypothetical protein